jgi:hypothetical protein
MVLSLVTATTSFVCAIRGASAVRRPYVFDAIFGIVVV